MRFGGGLAILPVALAVTLGLARAEKAGPQAAPARAALVSSLVLFSAGGAIGFLIAGSNVKVPAHYHGCIVGVTLALMGVVYVLLPKLGCEASAGRVATLQPYLYGFGQLLHITGLVWSGGYGVQRKVAGGEQILRTLSETVGMGMMGVGGLIAVVGGLIFIAIVLRSVERAWLQRR
jgi:heme/copper-type cytochrome/quinol oxidase subunit 1